MGFNMLIKRFSSIGANDLGTVYRPCSVSEMIGQETNCNIIKGYLDNGTTPHTQLFTGPPGCVDCDTEFFTGNGWKKISDYEVGDKVMQYDTGTGIATLIEPTNYIKNPSNKLYHFKTKYGLNQCLSKNHRVLYKHRKSGLHTDFFEAVMEDNRSNKYGFNGKFLTTFSIEESKGINFNDDELRVITMVIADAHIPYDRKKCCINIKKKRKISRAHKLLTTAGIEYTTLLTNGYTRFYFVPPIRIKEFDSQFYICNRHQLDIISSESLMWDGNQSTVFNTTSKQSADFIQYAFSACGIRATINIDDRSLDPVRPRSITYRVIKSNSNNIVGFDHTNKTVISEYTTKDGYEYCFTVPTSYLILRRNNCIFITGNCGKTTAARLIALGLNCKANEKSTSEPCLECKSCKSILNHNSMDVMEINVGRTGGKDAVNSIVDDLPLAPFSSRYKVLIFDEAHKLTKDAQDLLLKEMEDGYNHVYYIFCTNEPEKLKGRKKDESAFLSRCSVMHFGRISSELIFNMVKNVAEFEGMNYETEILSFISDEARGTPRDALVYLDQIDKEGSWTLEAAKNITGVLLDEDDPQIIELSRMLLGGKWKDSLNLYNELKKDTPAETIRIAAAGYFIGCLKRAKTVKEGKKFDKVLDVLNTPIYESGKLGDNRFYHYMFKVTDIINSNRGRN